MIKIYVLSLITSLERRAKVTSTMEEYGLNVEFIDGIDGRVDSHPYLDLYNEKAFIYNYRRPAAPGELGCYASHMLGWNKSVELNEPIIILEDDFIFSENTLKAFAAAEKLIDKFGFIRLETTKKKPTFKASQQDDFTLLHFLKVPQCATCYMISPKVAKTFIENSKQLVFPVDVFIRNVWVHKQPIYGLTPYTVKAGGHESVIGKRKKMPEKEIRTSVMCLITRLKNKLFNLVQQAKFILNKPSR